MRLGQGPMHKRHELDQELYMDGEEPQTLDTLVQQAPWIHVLHDARSTLCDAVPFRIKRLGPGNKHCFML